MENPLPTEKPPTQITNSPGEALIPPSQAPFLPSKSKKRPHDGYPLVRNSKYLRLRAVVKDLRPHFLEVLKAPDFQNCNSAQKIRDGIKLVLELYAQLPSETFLEEKCTSMPQDQPPSCENRDEQKPQQLPQDANSAQQPEPDRKHFPSGVTLEKQQAEDGQIHGKSVVGGSAFGWNFITFPGNNPVYYGVTKESFRASQENLQG